MQLPSESFDNIMNIRSKTDYFNVLVQSFMRIYNLSHPTDLRPLTVRFRGGPSSLYFPPKIHVSVLIEFHTNAYKTTNSKIVAFSHEIVVHKHRRGTGIHEECFLIHGYH